MHKATFYECAGLPEITSGRIDTSVKDFQSLQRAWLPEVRHFNVWCWDETRKVNNLILNEIFLFKTVLFSERIKWAGLKKQTKCCRRCSGSRHTRKMFQEWVLLAHSRLPVSPHVYEVLGSVMLGSFSAIWQGSESLSPGCQFFFSFAC